MCCVMGYTGHDLSAAKFKEYLLRTVMRGPDDQRVVEGPFGLMGFGRLAIMGLTPEGMQPFYRGADCVVCNGELYGFRFEKEILKRRGYKFQSDCDCEILLPLYYEYGLDMFRHMDSEFALIMYDSRKDRLIAARDPIGIRPLFYGYSKSSHQIAFASEMQNLIGWCDDIRPFPIGSYYCDGRFVRYEDIADVPAPMQDDMDTVLRNIREKLIAGVEKRLDADAPVGFLLSGGLDSSLVCSIAAKKLGKPIRTFAIGMDTDAIDLKYARQTAEYLGSEHHEIIINRDMVINSLEEVIRLLGTWDITTIRASMGMYLLCKAIHEQTDVRVLLTGEISDDLFGYKYTDYAPTADAFQQESQKRIRELYMYDVLRADRCISSNSIEARVPFGDLDFVRIAWVFGVNGNNFIKTMLKLGKERGAVKVVNDQIGSPTYTADLAVLLCDMIESEKYGNYHATNEGLCSWYDFACEIFKCAGMDVDVTPVAATEFPTKAKRPYNSRLNKDKLTENGFNKLPSWQDATKRYVDILMSQNS